jgi:hypothetical protein
MIAFIERLLDRGAQQRQAEMVLAANLAIREIKRRTIRELLDERRPVPTPIYDDVIDGTAEES